MGTTKPLPVKQQEITAVDISTFSSGLFQNGAQNAPLHSFIASKDVELTINGYITNRRNLQPFLPDTVENGYQKFPVLYKGRLYFFTLDAGKVKYCEKNDTVWTNCTGANTVTTQNGGIPTLQRVLDTILVINGGNGDKLAYVDLKNVTPKFPVVKYVLVGDPTSPLTAAGTNLNTTVGQSFSVYYAYTYTTLVGETLLSPILRVPVDRVRDQWRTGTPGKISLTFTDTVPAAAQFRNIYIALAATAGTIQATDMLSIAVKQPTNQTIFVDDGTLDINLGSTPPLVNSTDGPKVQYGIVENGNPILYGDPDNPNNIYIGGGGQFALSFSISNNGFTAQPELGTNFLPTVVIGFRTGQGQPAITVLFSNTEGLSRQAILTQQTVNYGNTSFSVWGLTEQHYGSAGVAAPNSAINYNGKLAFLSADGFVTLDTSALKLNVITAVNVSDLPIGKLVKMIKPSAMPTVCGTGWNGKYMWTIPSNGFDTPQQILVYDTSNEKTAFYTMDIPAQWLGVVTPPDEAAFVYACVGKSTYKLLDGTSSFDVIKGVNKPFNMSATGPMIGMRGDVHNVWQADVQAMFHVIGLIGGITVGINYRNESGRIKTKKRYYPGPTFTPSSASGWGDPGWGYGGNIPGVAYRGTPIVNTKNSAVTSVDVRIPVQVDDNMNEAQWFIETPIGFNAFMLRSVSYEGINLGIRPDLQ